MKDLGKLDDKCGENGWSACQWGVWGGRVVNVGVLVEAGAKGLIVDSEGRDMWDLWRLRWGGEDVRGVEEEGKGVGRVVGFGSNVEYQLGCRTRGIDLGCRVVKGGWNGVGCVVSAKRHSVVLDDEGRVFVCGSGKGGRLGLGDEDVRVEPVEVGLKYRVKMVAVGGNRSAVILENGALMMWGNGVLKPQKVELPGGFSAVDLTVGRGWLLVVDETGKVFGLGDNKWGQLALDETIKECAGLRVLPALSARRIVKVFVGSGAWENALCCGLEEGKTLRDLYVWGGQLLERRPRQLRCSRDKPVVKDVAIGDFFLLALTTDGSLWGCDLRQERGLKILQRDVESISAHGDRFAVVKSLGACHTYRWKHRWRSPQVMRGIRRVSTISLQQHHGVGLLIPSPAQKSEVEPIMDSVLPSLVTMCEDLLLEQHLDFFNVHELAFVASTYSIERLLDKCFDLLIPNFDIYVALHGPKAAFEMLGMDCMLSIEKRLLGENACKKRSELGSEEQQDCSEPECIVDWAFATRAINEHIEPLTADTSHELKEEVAVSAAKVAVIKDGGEKRTPTESTNRTPGKTNKELINDGRTSKDEKNDKEKLRKASDTEKGDRMWPTLKKSDECATCNAFSPASKEHLRPSKRRSRKHQQSVMTLGGLPSQSCKDASESDGSPERAIRVECGWKSSNRDLPTKLDLRTSLRKGEKAPSSGLSLQEIQRQQQIESKRDQQLHTTPTSQKNMIPVYSDKASEHTSSPITIRHIVGNAAPPAWGHSPPRSETPFLWSPSSILPQSPPQPRQSLRDIMKSEEQTLGTSPVRPMSVSQFGTSPPRRGWNFLPGDGPARGKSLKLIETEERAMKSLRKQFPGMSVHRAHNQEQKSSS